MNQTQSTGRGGALYHRARTLVPGILLSATIALAATFLSEHYGGPAMLFALLLGIAFHFLYEDGPCRPGIEFCAKQVLRFGVALLGMRITIGQIVDLGATSLALVIALVFLTIGFGLLMARVMRRPWALGLLSGGAVAICGASAALAIAAVLPPTPERENDTLRTVVGVTALSTLAMIAYPPVFAVLGLDPRAIGFMIGATIHDVAQVVGAGYSVSDVAGDTATMVKLLRVAMLPVVLILVHVAMPRREDSGKVAFLPAFMIAFLILSLASSVLPVPDMVRSSFDTLSRGCLVAAISALGIKTSLKALIQGGGVHISMLTAQTLFLMVTALALGHWLLAL